jgi:hypothetical protein
MEVNNMNSVHIVSLYGGKQFAFSTLNEAHNFVNQCILSDKPQVYSIPLNAHIEHDIVNQFIAQYKTEHGIPWIVCNDGFTISVQAGFSNYCSPRSNNVAMYTELEVAAPHLDKKSPVYKEPLLQPYLSKEDRICLYVPVDILVNVIGQHGGISHPLYEYVIYR